VLETTNGLVNPASKSRATFDWTRISRKRLTSGPMLSGENKQADSSAAVSVSQVFFEVSGLYFYATDPQITQIDFMESA
jgi:hypothetical protein